MPKWCTVSRPSRPSTGLSGTTPHVTWRARGRPPNWWGGDLNFDLDYPLRAPPSVLASLLTRRLVDADVELASALGRDPLCSYQGPEGTRPSRIDGLLVDTRLVTLLHTAERLPRGAIPGHAPVRFDLHLRGASQPVVKFVRPKPVAPAPREEHERLPLEQRLLDPLEAGWRAALSTGDVDRAWAFWTTTAEETLLALACPWASCPGFTVYVHWVRGAVNLADPISRLHDQFAGDLDPAREAAERKVGDLWAFPDRKTVFLWTMGVPMGPFVLP